MFRKWVTFADVIVTSHCRRQHAPVQTRYHTSNRPWHRVRDASKLIFCIWREIEYIVLYIKMMFVSFPILFLFAVFQ